MLLLVMEKFLKGLYPGLGRMGKEALALPNHCQCPGNLGFHEGDVDDLPFGNALTDAVWQEGDAQMGMDHFGDKIPVAALTDDFGLGHDLLKEGHDK